MIANFNVENVFVIVMKDRLHKFEKLSFSVLKKIIIIAMVTISIAIISFFQGIFLDVKDNSVIIVVLSMMAINYFNYKFYVKTRETSKFSRAYIILNSDEFKSIYVNNEELFDIIQSISNSIGKCECFNSILKYETIQILICAIITISLFFL